MLTGSSRTMAIFESTEQGHSLEGGLHEHAMINIVFNDRLELDRLCLSGAGRGRMI
ncbi:MAG: hypothetical protein M3Z35_04300 [Nitrospirota bacterium]|nr:hypothetical protein [Nitrospirota bacterium]